MSNLMPCNWCTLVWMRARAVETGKVLTERPDPTGDGVEVFMHAPGEEPSESNWKAYFLAVSEKCACNDCDSYDIIERGRW